MRASLDTLPAELYSAILSQTPLLFLQHSTYSLIRAIPRSPVPRYHLFTFIRLASQRQILSFSKFLRNNPEIIGSVRGLSLESWTVDPEVAINLIDVLRHVQELWLCIGPNFTPERLEEIIRRPFDHLENLSLRFKPYVEKATYYPFLKGAYFDSTLVALSQWPSSTYLPNLSIIQEPLETSSSFNNTFAQPIVFFDFEPLSNMVSSPFATNLTSLRLRIPSREITRFLCSPPRSMPNIGLLDLTTCRITETDIEALLGRFLTLRYLIVDKSLVVGGRDGDFRDGGMMMMNRWTALGKRMALAGVKSAKNREISVKTWLESQVRFITEETTTDTAQEENTPDEVPPALPPHSKFKKKGRKGLSTATISIRERKRVLAYTSYATPGPSNDTSSPPPIQKVRILPPVPRLRAISLSVPATLSNDPKLIESAQANFTRGWSEGLAQLVAIRSRIRTSWRKGTRVLIFNGVRSVRDEECKEDALDGLEDIEDEEGFLIKIEEEGECPIICFAGSSKRSGKGHVEDCAHSKGWEVWGDEL